VDLGYVLFTLLCPLSMVALLGWWAWSMRPGRNGSRHTAPVRSTAEKAELARLRAHLDSSQASETQVSSR
jgi:hypothetical protein